MVLVPVFMGWIHFFFEAHQLRTSNLLPPSVIITTNELPSTTGHMVP
jgi:hypothetical protein